MKIHKKKLKPTLQISQTECGLCCIRTILEAYGYQVSLGKLENREGMGLEFNK